MNLVNESLESIVKIADESRSRQMVAEAVRTAYALGKLDGIIEVTRRQIEAQKAAREKSGLNS
jgi:hypothetical protein